MKNVLIVTLSGAALAGALYFTWQKGRESAGSGGAAASLERRMEALDRRMTALDERLAEGGEKSGGTTGNSGAVSALLPASGPPISPPVLTDEQVQAAPPVDAELTGAVQKAVVANPGVRDALTYFAFSTQWVNANRQTVDSFKSWCKAAGGAEQASREGIQRKVAMAINAANWSNADKDPATAGIMQGLREEVTRGSRITYDPEQTGRFANAEKFVDHSTSPPTIDMHALGQDMGANMKLTKTEAQIEIPQESIDHEWNHGRAVLLYMASQNYLKQHAPELLEAVAKHPEEIPVLLARLGKP